MKSFRIYQYAPRLLDLIYRNENAYLRSKQRSFEDALSPYPTSSADFQREDFIANVMTSSLSPEEIAMRVHSYTENQALTDTILSPAGGQALLSIPQLILERLTIPDDEELNRYYKTGSFRRLLYTKNSKGEHYIKGMTTNRCLLY